MPNVQLDLCNIQFLQNCRNDPKGGFGKTEHADNPLAKVFPSNSVEIFLTCRINILFFNATRH